MDIKTVLLKVINENTSQDGRIYGMWVLQYFVDNKSVSVKIVCGQKKIKDDGSIWWVAKGMTPKDFAALKPHYAEFAALAANPPAAPPEPSKEPEMDETEVPF